MHVVRSVLSLASVTLILSACASGSPATATGSPGGVAQTPIVAATPPLPTATPMPATAIATPPVPTMTAAPIAPTGAAAAPTPAPTVAPTSAPTPVAAPATPAGQVSFSRNVLPIFQERCVRCHSGPEAPFKLELTSYASVMKGSVQYKVIKPGDPPESYLYQYVESEFMPLGGPPLTKEQKETIRAWIAAGAPDN